MQPNNKPAPTYTVWIGGIADLENASLEKATEVLNQWQAEGYTDAVIELETPSTN